MMAPGKDDRSDLPERWIAVDWGTSNLRAWIMQRGGVLERRTSDDGMNTLAPDGFEPALLALVGDAMPADGTLEAMVCGMAGARQGWVEAPYMTAPCAPPGGADAVKAPTRSPRLLARLLPGIRQNEPADVMRGEETQISGVLATRPEFDGVVCLPGTHTKWVRVAGSKKGGKKGGEVTAFRTFMTGETFALLSDRSVLRHSVDAQGLDDAVFARAVAQGVREPGALMANLFGIRAASLLHDASLESGRARLSGLLIGAELGAVRDWWEGAGPVLVVGADTIGGRYETALRSLGARTERLDGETVTLAGLVAAQAQSTTDS